MPIILRAHPITPLEVVQQDGLVKVTLKLHDHFKDGSAGRRAKTCAPLGFSDGQYPHHMLNLDDKGSTMYSVLLSILFILH